MQPGQHHAADDVADVAACRHRAADRRARTGSAGARAVFVPARSCPARSAEARRAARPPASRTGSSRRAVPAPMPWPMKGGVRWAASPSRKTLSSAPAVGQLGAERVLGDADELEPVGVDAGDPGCDQRVKRRNGIRSRRPSRRGSSWNSHRYRVSPIRMNVPARCGSQTWCTPSHWFRSAAVADIDDEPALFEPQVVHPGADRLRARRCWRRRIRARSPPGPSARGR